VWRADSVRLCDARVPSEPDDRIDLPSCIRSKPLLISSSLRTWVIIGSIRIFPFMYQSTIFGTSVRPHAPPNAAPFQTRPVEVGHAEAAAPFLLAVVDVDADDLVGAHYLGVPSS
jgi:hypothetical protein